jgi:hypothetical protein
MILHLGSRGSRLALAQAELATGRLRAPGVEIALVPITTAGDRDRTKPFGQIGARGVFVKELEEALLDGRIDVAVHSAKDMTSTDTSGLAVGAYLEREDPRDARIAREPSDVLRAAEINDTGESARALDLDPVIEDLHADVISRHAVGAVRNGIDEALQPRIPRDGTNVRERALWTECAPHREELADDCLGLAYLTEDGPFDLHVRADLLATTCAARSSLVPQDPHERLRELGLRVPGEEEHGPDRRSAVVRRQATCLEERRRRI